MNCHKTAPDEDRPFTARVAMHIDSQTRTRDLSFVHTKHAAMMSRLEGLAGRILSLHLAFNEQITVQARAIQGQDALMERAKKK